MSTQELSPLLSSVPLLADLPAPVLAELLTAATVRKSGADELVQVSGQSPAGLWMLIKGEGVYTTENPQINIRFEVGRLHPGDHTEELALLTELPAESALRSVKRSEWLLLPREEAMNVLVRHPGELAVLTRRVAQRLASQRSRSDLERVDLATITLDLPLYLSFPEALLKRHRVIPLALKGSVLSLAMVDPEDTIGLDAVRRSMYGVTVRPVTIGKDEYETFLQKVLKPALVAGTVGGIVRSPLAAEAINPGDIQYFSPYDPARKEVSGATQAVRLIDEILAAAMSMDASDVHLIPDGPALVVRFRVDGRLRDWDRSLAIDMAPSIISRIKIISGLDIAEKRHPQDGRFGLEYHDTTLDLRVATMPSRDGERITMRLLNPAANLLPLDQIFLADKLASLVRQLTFRNSGLLLVTGPTGSGKTTTLYSLLSERLKRSPEFSIQSVEDPIEYRLAGITQVQVNEAAGLTFPSVLRGFLRHDPDVILVGEMRDQVTARIAAQASLTGHLVFSSMHTIDALGTIDRLADMGIEPYLLANALIGIISQRLVRRLCPRCAEAKEFPPQLIQRLISTGVLSAQEPVPPLYFGSGCDHCGGTGYRGRVAVFELLPVNSSVQELIVTERARARRKELAMTTGYIPLERYAQFLLTKGLTTPSEVMRIVLREL